MFHVFPGCCKFLKVKQLTKKSRKSAYDSKLLSNILLDAPDAQNPRIKKQMIQYKSPFREKIKAAISKTNIKKREIKHHFIRKSKDRICREVMGWRTTLQPVMLQITRSSDYVLF